MIFWSIGEHHTYPTHMASTNSYEIPVRSDNNLNFFKKNLTQSSPIVVVHSGNRKKMLKLLFQ